MTCSLGGLGTSVVVGKLDLYRDGSLIALATGATGTKGAVTFSLKNAKSGSYTTTVTDVSATGLTRDGITSALSSSANSCANGVAREFRSALDEMGLSQKDSLFRVLSG